MTMAEVRTIGVIGGGTMGNGIVHVAAKSGFKVVLLDVEQRFIDRAMSTISKDMDRGVAKNKIKDSDKSAAFQRIHGTTDNAAMAKADFIVEAVMENLDVKSRIFAAMDEIARILDLPPIKVYEVATFYSMYNLAPVGKYLVQCCTTTPCWLRGSGDIVKACEKKTGCHFLRLSPEGPHY